MQAIAPEFATSNNTASVQRGGVVITLEGIAYVLLILFVLVTRLAELDSVPISAAETPRALAAWHSTQLNAENYRIPDAPALFWAQRLGFLLFGSSEFSARVLTALLGGALTLAPLAFRRLLGPGRTLVFCVLLAFSPSLLLAARFSAPSIWGLAFAAAGLWMTWRFWQQGSEADAVAATVAFIALILLSEPGGITLMLILAGAALIALSLTSTDITNDEDIPEYMAAVRARFVRWPLASGAALGAAVVIAVSTGFMTYSQGLSSVGEVVSGFISRLGQGNMTALAAALFYEPLVWFFAAAGAFVLSRQGVFSFIDRFFAAWLSLAILATIFFGGDVTHAVWIVIPLMGLATGALADTFRDDRTQSLWVPLQDEDADINRLYTTQVGRAILTAVALGLVTMLVLHVQILGREALLVESGQVEDLITRVFQSPSPVIRGGGLWTLVTILFMVVGFFLAASIWGQTTTLQGAALGLLAFMLINNVSNGWDAAVFHASSPVEPWHQSSATSEQLPLLRQTLIDLAQRETEGELLIPITVVVDPAIGLTRESTVAWALRDFKNVKYVADIGAARAREVVLMKLPEVVVADENGVLRPEALDLGGSYVGQQFALRNLWSSTSMRPLDVVAWWFQRKTRTAPVPGDHAMLWVRIDVYNSQPFSPSAG